MGYTLPAEGCVREATQNITMLVMVSYSRLPGPSARLICKRTEAAAIKCSISLRCYFTENQAAFGGQPVPGSLRDTHSSDAHNSLQAGQVAPPTARCKTSAELSSLEKRDFSESQKTR